MNPGFQISVLAWAIAQVLYRGNPGAEVSW